MSRESNDADTRPPIWIRRVGVAVALLMGVGLSACTAAQSPTSAGTAPAAEVLPLPDGDLAAGTYRYPGFTVPVQITVPAGWAYSADAGLFEKGDTFVKFDTASHVPRDACRWRGTLDKVGPTVEDFAIALDAALSTTMTEANPVAVSDFRGLQFDLAVESGIQLADCDESHVCIHSVGSWCSRYYHQSVNQRETYRVLNLDGDRAIMTVGQWDDVDHAMTEEARAVFDSIAFVSGE
jgi:hypothetical protein